MSASAARLVEIAKLLESEGESALAEAVLDDAARRFPGDVTVLMALAGALWASGQGARALAVCLRAEALAPDDPAMHYNIAMMAGWVGDHARESASLERMVANAPGDAALRFRLAESLDRQGRFDAAIASYELAIQLDPREPLHHIHLGYALLRLGNWDRGWDEMSWYWRPEGLCRFSSWFEQVSCPRLAKGDSVAGKSIVMTGWGGAGDSVMFLRMAAKLVEHGASRVTVHVTGETAFLERNRWGFAVVNATTPAGLDALYAGHDACVSAPQVPQVLGLAPAAFACDEPCFIPDAARQDAWRRRIGPPNGRMKVGIAWSGNPTNIYEHNRSIETARIAKLLDVPGVDWYVVQKNSRNPEMAALARPGVHDWSDDCADVDESAALVSLLDLVISVDSLPAHLAAGIGVPTWLLLCKAGDWRWGVGGDTTPWYRRMTIFRQRTLGDWDEVLGRVAHKLANLRSH